MTSLIKVDNIAPSAGGTEFSLTRGVAKAWVNFNGTGTVAIRDSENVSSITDSGTGVYTLNLSNDFDVADYSICASTTGGAGAYSVAGPDTQLSSSFAIYTSDGSTAQEDKTSVWACSHGDLA